MTSLTPSRPDRSLAIAGGVAALAVVVLALGLLYGFVAGGWAAGIGVWMTTTTLGTVVRYALESLLMLVAVLISTAILIYGERKVWAAVQMRRGPNVVGPWGSMQPFADFLKFILKEPIIPSGANKGVFILAPLVGVVLAMAAVGGYSCQRTVGWSATSTSAFSIYSPSLRSASTASSWRGGRRTPNMRFSRRCVRRRRWSPTRFRSASSSSRCCCAPAR